jgi:ketosteroid isomerase-like protein
MYLTPREVFLKLVQGVSDQDLAGLPELYADHTDVRHPMSPTNAPALTSRDAIREHFSAGPPSPNVRMKADNVVIHETADPEVIVAEFDYAGDHDGPFKVSCIFVLRVRDGVIVESRDYIDHLRFARVRGQLDDLYAAIS